MPFDRNKLAASLGLCSWKALNGIKHRTQGPWRPEEARSIKVYNMLKVLLWQGPPGNICQESTIFLVPMDARDPCQNGGHLTREHELRAL